MPGVINNITTEQLLQENAELRLRLQETEETLNAIRNGEVDAIVVSGDNGEKVFTLASSETPYRIILEEMDEGAVTVTSDGVILYFNRRFSEIVNTPLDQIIGSNFSDFVDDTERASFHNLLLSSRKEKIRGQIKGKYLQLRLSLVPLPEEMEGDICIIVSDITEIRMYQDSLKHLVKEQSHELETANLTLRDDLIRLKKIEKQLRESEGKFKLLANSIPQMVWIAQSDGQRLWFNQRWYDYTGTNYQQMKGFGWYKVHDPVILPKLINRWNKAVSSGKSFKMVIPLRAKDGTYRDFLTMCLPLADQNGQITQWFGTNTDLSEIRKVEKELEESRNKLTLALENGNIGTWEWNLKTNEMVWDERMHKIFGIDHEGFNYNYPTFEKFINEEDLQHFREAVKRSLIYNSPFETVFRTNTANGNESKYISTKALLNKDKKGKPLSLNGVCFDITSMKKGSEQVLIKLNEELLRSNRDLQQFAYVASHDLQEPLRMVSSFTQLLAHRYGDKLDGDANEFIRFAVEGAKRMYDLLNSLLAYSRVQSKGKEFSRINMNEVLGKVTQNLTLKIEEKKAVINYGNLPFVLADENQMIQLVQNLVENSLKFTNGSPVISISSRFDNDKFIFSVKDNGLGIEPQYFERIFQIFQRLHSREAHEGTGIGLAICKRIVERHKGSIWVESEPGKGSEFFFTLPS